jgi:site-specific DNA recombinase
MRAAIYARMSSDKQSASSPDDQIARCRAYAEREGWDVVVVETDAGISGASRHNRPGLLAVMANIASWDVLLVWDSARIARDSEDLGWVRKRLKFERRIGIEVSSGLDLENIGSKVMGVLNEEYLVKLRADTIRGLEAAAQRRNATGAPPYGYVTVEGETVGRRVVIHEPHAEHVRQLFAGYIAGDGIRALARVFNEEGIPSPRQRRKSGKVPSWSPSAIRSILLNPHYRGEIIWNRSEFRKDPDTGVRKRRERPESEWIRRHDESLRIVDDETFGRVAALFAERGRKCRLPGPDPSRKGTPPKYPLSGILQCGECGGSFHSVKAGRAYGCSWHRDRGPAVCDFDSKIARTEIEDRLFGALRDRILTPDAIAFVVDRAISLVRERLASGGGDVNRIRARLDQVDGELENLVRKVAQLGDLPAFDSTLDALKTERAHLVRRLAVDEDVPDLSLNEIRAAVERGASGFRDSISSTPEVARRALRALLGNERIRIVRDRVQGYRMEGVFRLGLETTGHPMSGAQGVSVCLVAGEGFEPPTSGL